MLSTTSRELLFKGLLKVGEIAFQAWWLASTDMGKLRWSEIWAMIMFALCFKHASSQFALLNGTTKQKHHFYSSVDEVDINDRFEMPCPHKNLNPTLKIRWPYKHGFDFGFWSPKEKRQVVEALKLSRVKRTCNWQPRERNATFWNTSSNRFIFSVKSGPWGTKKLTLFTEIKKCSGKVHNTTFLDTLNS